MPVLDQSLMPSRYAPSRVISRSARAAARIAPLLVAPLVTLFAACDSPVDPLRGVRPVPDAQEASAAIGPAGGQVELESSDGARFTLIVPATALDTTVTITMYTTEASRAQRFQVRFAPAGLVFNEAATMEVTLPARNGVGPASSLIYDAAPIVTQRGTDGIFRAPVRAFAEGGAVLSAEPAPTSPPQPATSPLPPPCTPGFDSREFVHGALTVIDDPEPGAYSLCAMALSWALRDEPTYATALRLADATDAFLARAAAELPTALDYLRTETCTGLTGALTALDAAPMNGYGQILPPMLRVLYWMRQDRRIDADCAAYAGALPALETAATDAADFYASRRGTATGTDSPNYLLALLDAEHAARVVPRLHALGTPPSVRDFAAYLVGDVIRPAQLYAMLPVAYRACYESGDASELLRWRRFVGPLPSLNTAMQYCGTRLTLESRDSSGTVIDSIVTPMGGTATPESPITYDTIAVRANGTLRLLGPIRAMACPAGTGGAEQLVVALGGHAAQILVASPYFAQAETYDLAALRAAASIAPGDLGDRVLTLTRTLDPCGNSWGPLPAPLLTIVLRFAP